MNGRSSQAIVINCDSVDDNGQLVCMLPKQLARRLHDTLTTAGRAAGVTPVIRRILPRHIGRRHRMDTGWPPALTVSRGRMAFVSSHSHTP